MNITACAATVFTTQFLQCELTGLYGANDESLSKPHHACEIDS